MKRIERFVMMHFTVVKALCTRKRKSTRRKSIYYEKVVMRREHRKKCKNTEECKKFDINAKNKWTNLFSCCLCVMCCYVLQCVDMCCYECNVFLCFFISMCAFMRQVELFVTSSSFYIIFNRKKYDSVFYVKDIIGPNMMVIFILEGYFFWGGKFTPF